MSDPSEPTTPSQAERLACLAERRSGQPRTQTNVQSPPEAAPTAPMPPAAKPRQAVSQGRCDSNPDRGPQHCHVPVDHRRARGQSTQVVERDPSRDSRPLPPSSAAPAAPSTAAAPRASPAPAAPQTVVVYRTVHRTVYVYDPPSQSVAPAEPSGGAVAGAPAPAPGGPAPLTPATARGGPAPAEPAPAAPEPSPAPSPAAAPPRDTDDVSAPRGVAPTDSGPTSAAPTAHHRTATAAAASAAASVLGFEVLTPVLTVRSYDPTYWVADTFRAMGSSAQLVIGDSPPGAMDGRRASWNGSSSVGAGFVPRVSYRRSMRHPGGRSP